MKAERPPVCTVRDGKASQQELGAQLETEASTVWWCEVVEPTRQKYVHLHEEMCVLCQYMKMG